MININSAMTDSIMEKYSAYRLIKSSIFHSDIDSFKFICTYILRYEILKVWKLWCKVKL